MAKHRPNGHKPLKSDTAQVKDGAGAAPELIDPIWVLKALGGLVAVALVCGYLTLALLFWQGAWQIVLHPTHTAATLQLPNVTMQPVKFAVDESGHAQLNGFWIPGDGRHYAVLYLRGGDGQLAGNMTDRRNLMLLHNAGLSVLAFDYRGYGVSAKPHPTEKHMAEDAEWALRFLNEDRGVSAGHVIVFGEGLGAVLASQLGRSHNGLAALVLDQADANAERRVKDDPSGRLLPVGLLLRDSFQLKEPLKAATAPKLLMATEPATGVNATTNDGVRKAAYTGAADPKMVVTLVPGVDATAQMSAALSRFLDAWVPGARGPAVLVPNPQ